MSLAGQFWRARLGFVNRSICRVNAHSRCTHNPQNEPDLQRRSFVNGRAGDCDRLVVETYMAVNKFRRTLLQ